MLPKLDYAYCVTLNMNAVLCLQMDGVINSNLAELDVTPDVFYEACQVSRDSRDINKRVFEKLLAMEDFTVFKKIMVKRNTELQFEAMQAYKEYAGLSLGGGDQDELALLPNPDELEQLLGERDDELENEDYDADKVRATCCQLSACLLLLLAAVCCCLLAEVVATAKKALPLKCSMAHKYQSLI